MKKRHHLPLFSARCWILEKLYEVSVWAYTRLFKMGVKPWDLRPEELSNYAPDTLGNRLGQFIQRHNFSIQDKLESHDVFHVLTGTGISVPEEISMQFLLYANGKRSIYGIFTAAIGSLLIPEYWATYKAAYQKGKTYVPLHEWDLKSMLHEPIASIQHRMTLLHNKPVIQ